MTLKIVMPKIELLQIIQIPDQDYTGISSLSQRQLLFGNTHLDLLEARWGNVSGSGDGRSTKTSEYCRGPLKHCQKRKVDLSSKSFKDVLVHYEF